MARDGVEPPTPVISVCFEGVTGRTVGCDDLQVVDSRDDAGADVAARIDDTSCRRARSERGLVIAIR